MILHNDQLSQTEISELDDLLYDLKQHNESPAAVYKHLLMIRRENPSNFLFYSQDIETNQKKLVGLLSVFYFYQHACEISLIIHPQYRKKNIDQTLFTTALPFIQKHSLNHIIFSTSPDFIPEIIKKLKSTLYNSEYHLIQAIEKPKDFSLTSFSVRPAQAKDLPQLCEIDQICFPNMSNTHEMHARFAIIMTDPNYHILVALKDDRIIGKVHLRFDESISELSDFCITPASQHQGYGKELLNYAIAYVSKQNIKMLTLDVETTAKNTLNLYTSSGFSIEKTIHFYKADLPK